MTNREFYTNIVNGTVGEAEVAFAVAAIEKLDAVNEKRKAKTAEGTSKKAEENAPLISEALVVLGTETKVASDVAEVMGINVQKASYLLRALVAQGKATVEDIKVPKKGTVKAYTAVIVDAE